MLARTQIPTVATSSTRASLPFPTNPFAMTPLQRARRVRRRRRRRRRLLLLAMIIFESQTNPTFRHFLNAEGRQRRDRNLIRAALHDPTNSTWQKCFHSGDDGVLITITGFDHETFNYSFFWPYALVF